MVKDRQENEPPKITRVASGLFPRGYCGYLRALPTFTDSNAVEVDVLWRIFQVLPPASYTKNMGG